MASRNLSSTLVCAFLLASHISGQLNGKYAIDPAGTGGRTYKTFGAAVSALIANGMSGPVEFVVAKGTYVEDISIVPFRGMSRTNTLTFKSAVKHGAVLQAKSAKDTIATQFSTAANPVSGLILDGFRFVGKTTVFRAITPTTDLEIKNCHVQPDDGFVIRSEVGTDPQRWNVHHNLFEQTRVTTQFYVTILKGAGCEIHHNDMRLRGNNAVFMTSAPSFSSAPNRIYNNLILGDTNRVGIHLDSGGFDVEVTHNTFLLGGNGSNVACIFVGGADTRPNKILSNIFVMDRLGSCLLVGSLSTTKYKLDGNLYHLLRSTRIAQVTRGSDYKTLVSWRKASGQEKSSRQGDPLFIGGLSRPFDVHLKPKSPAIDAGVATPSYVKDDFDGFPRIGTADIGALELFNRFEVFGAGCAGTGGKVPTIGQTGEPKIGSANFAVTLGNALGGSPRAFFAIGGSNKAWGSVPLPLNFGGKCSLLVSGDVITSISVSGLPGPGFGYGSIKIPIPNDSTLIDVRVYFQWGVADAGAVGIGVAFSNGAILRLKR